MADGDPDHAARHLADALAADPRLPDAREALAELDGPPDRGDRFAAPDRDLLASERAPARGQHRLGVYRRV